jgi:hypothetical protein
MNICPKVKGKNLVEKYRDIPNVVKTALIDMLMESRIGMFLLFPYSLVTLLNFGAILQFQSSDVIRFHQIDPTSGLDLLANPSLHIRQ